MRVTCCAFTLHSQTGAVETVLEIGKHVNTMLYWQVRKPHTVTYIHKVEVSSLLAVTLKQAI